MAAKFFTILIVICQIYAFLEAATEDDFTTSSKIVKANNAKGSSAEEGGGSNECAPSTRPKLVSNWLFDTVPWIKRKELAKSSLSTSNSGLKQLCWPKLHQNVKPHKIYRLTFFVYNNGFSQGNFQFRCGNAYSEITIPVASILLPDYIQGFEWIDIKNSVNDEIAYFFKRNAHLIQDCYIYFIPVIPLNTWESDKKRVASMYTFLESLADNVHKFDMNRGNPNAWHFNDFNRLFPGILNRIQFIVIRGTIRDIDDIMNWLIKYSISGKQKILSLHSVDRELTVALTNRIKIHYHEEFTLENERTNEILTLFADDRIIVYDGPSDDPLLLYGPTYSYMARYPKGEEQWMEDGLNKCLDLKFRETSIQIVLRDI